MGFKATRRYVASRRKLKCELGHLRHTASKFPALVSHHTREACARNVPSGCFRAHAQGLWPLQFLLSWAAGFDDGIILSFGEVPTPPPRGGCLLWAGTPRHPCRPPWGRVLGVLRAGTQKHPGTPQSLKQSLDGTVKGPGGCATAQRPSPFQR